MTESLEHPSVGLWVSVFLHAPGAAAQPEERALRGVCAGELEAREAEARAQSLATPRGFQTLRGQSGVAGVVPALAAGLSEGPGQLLAVLCVR